MAISDTQFTAWLLQDNASRCVLVELDYQQEVAGVPTTLTMYLSDRVYFDGTGAHPYIDGIAVVPQFSRSLGGNQLGTYSSSLGSLELDNADGRFDSILTLAIDGSAIRFYLGDVTWARADFRFVFSALSIKAVAPSFDRISVQLKDTGLLLDKSIGGEIRVGGTGPNADRWRPVNFGLVHQVECLVLNPSTLTYVHSDTSVGLVPGSTVVRDRGIPVVFTENGDGTFALARSPDGTITADVLYVATSIGHDRRCISDAMLTFIGQRSGLVALGLYAGAGPTYEVRSPTDVGIWLLAGGEDYQIGISLPDKRNVLDLLGDLTDSGLCFWAIRRDGMFTFGRLRPNDISVLGVASTKVFTEDLIDEGSLQLEHLTPTYYQLQATMSKNWSIQSNLASSLSPEEHARFSRTGLYAIQGNGIGVGYGGAPQLYNKTLVQSPQIETLLSGSDDSTDKAYLQSWMEVRRAMSLPWLTILTMVVGIDAYDVELGDPVTVRIPRFGYDAGVDFQVIGIDIRLPAKIELRMIRRDVQEAYDSRATTPADGAPYSGAAKILISTATFIAGEAYGLPLGTAPARTITVVASIIPGTASGSTGGAGGGDSFVQAAYVTIGNDSRLTSERALTAGTGITITDNGANSTVVINAAAAASPLTTKGDVYGHSTVDARIPVGSDNTVLTADSSLALGVKWAAVSAGGVLQGQEYTSTGAFTFNVPSGVTSVWITAMGAGGAGGGATSSAVGAGGGGAGEQIIMQPHISVGGGTITGSVGTKGSGVAGAVGGAGGNTTCGVFTAIGGLGGTTTVGAKGGGVAGGAGGANGNPGSPGVLGAAEALSFFGGSGGGGGGNGTVSNGGLGGASGGTVGGAFGTAGTSQGGGGGGASTMYGVGGSAGNGGSSGSAATTGHYGAGGGGGGGKTSGTTTGGAGADGYVLIQWIS